MNSFFRALRITLRYRWLCALSVICAVGVAVLWGGNITAIYPIVEVVFEGDSLDDWLAREIADARGKAAAVEQQLAELESGASELAPEERAAESARLGARLEAERKAIGRYEFVRPYVVRFSPRDPFVTLVIVIGALLVGTLVKNVFFVGHSIVVAVLAQLTTFNLRKEFYRKTLHMDLASFDTEGTNQLMSRFTHDMEHLALGLYALLGKAVREPLKMFVCLAGAAWICWRLLLLSIVIAPLAAFLIGRLARILKRANRRAMEEMTLIYGILEETFQGIKIVKAFTMERYERRRFHGNSKKYYHKALRIARYDSLTRPVTEIMGIVMIGAALIAGAYLVLEHQTHLLHIRMSDRPMSLGSLLLFYGFLAGVSDPARKLSDVFNRIQKAAAAADRIFYMIDRESRITDPPAPVRVPRHHRSLRMENVQFSYRPGLPVLEDIDLEIPFGESVALVGPNGCGKSTLVNLVPRFADPTEGRVLIDGVDLRDMRLRHLRRQIGLVTQETLLFDDTVLANIRYGSPHATREEVIAAARQAHAHRFIEERLDAGYDTLVGQRGMLLSGGQRQRIALARAILRDPAILILDEATSQVDIESEQLIHQVLEQFIRNRTTLIITHRMSTLALADRIVVMESGRILDVGTHDELLGRCDAYRRLHDIQFRQIA